MGFGGSMGLAGVTWTKRTAIGWGGSERCNGVGVKVAKAVSITACRINTASTMMIARRETAAFFIGVVSA